MKTFLALVAATALAGISTTSASPPHERPLRFDQSGEPYPETVPSFDCASATTFPERQVCSDVSLGWSDRHIAWAYGRIQQHVSGSSLDDLRLTQREWLSARDRCSDPACLKELYTAREASLSKQLDRTDAKLRMRLRRVGACEETKIDWIGGRFPPTEGEALQGTSVGYANGVWQVSYDPEPKVFRSRIGDPVKVCLVHVPTHCPPGDRRGWTYSTVNLRTKDAWKLWNSSHGCGGA